MIQRKSGILALLLGGLLLAGPAQAHSPLCACLDNGDGTITCEGGFSDGSGAAGVAMEVRNGEGKTLVKGRMDRLSTFTFKKPADRNFTVLFDGGPGHAVEIGAKEISQ